MKLISKKNLIFIYTVILLGFLIGLFNYSVDSYHLFHKKDNYIDIFGKPDTLIPVYIQNYADIKNETLMIGFSDTQLPLGNIDFYKYKLYNALFFKNTNCMFVYECLKQYLSLHKETKKVLFFISYNIFLNPLDENCYKFSISNKIEKYLFLLYSKDVTKANIKFVINKILYNNSSKANAEDGSKTEERLTYYPNFKMKFNIDIKEVNKISEINYKYCNKIFDLFKENNIDYEVIIPPYNTIYFACLKKYKKYKIIEKIKKDLVNKVGIVYDFSVINRLTTTNMKDGSNCWFYLMDHANPFYGNKMVKFLFYNVNDDKNLYVKLAKNNINEQIKLENDKLNNFIDKNQKYVDFYTKVDRFPDKIQYQQAFFTAKLPKEIIQDEKFIYNKIFEKRNNKK